MQQNSRLNGVHSIAFYWNITAILWVAAGGWYLFPPAPATVEYYFNRGWYRWMLDWVTPLTEWFRYPLILILLPGACLCFLVFWAKNWTHIRWAQRRSHWSGFSWGLKRLACALPILVLWFLAFWGAGYRRLPVETRLHMDTSVISEPEMLRFRGLLLRQINGNLVASQSRDPLRSVRAISLSMTRIIHAWDGLPIRLPDRVKFTPAGFLMCNGTSGICSPFTLEPLVDNGLPDASAVNSAAHELGHIAGFCAEDEASFVGYLAGMQAEDSFARYACSLSAYMDAIGSLSKNGFEMAFEALPDVAKRDVRREEDAFRRYRVAWFSRISWPVYNRYLQSQGIDEGLKNYSHGITLLCYALRGVGKQQSVRVAE